MNYQIIVMNNYRRFEAQLEAMDKIHNVKDVQFSTEKTSTFFGPDQISYIALVAYDDKKAPSR